MTVAVLIAGGTAGEAPTAAPTGDSPPAMLPFLGGTVLRHVRDHLDALGVDRQYVLSRPWHATRLRYTGGVEVCESHAPAGDLHWVARLSRDAHEAGEPLVVLPADLTCHREALAELLVDTRVATRALVTATRSSGISPVRIEHERVVSAGSAYHRVSGANASFLGVLQVGPDSAWTLAGLAGRLAPLAARECLDDVPALLLVAAVRAGVVVDARDVRTLHCRRVTDRDAAGTAEAALRGVDEERVLLDSVVKADDGFFTTFFVSPYSKYVARWAARRGCTPNTVTAISLAIGLGAAGCFAWGTRAGLVVGAVLLQASFTADCVDGQLARYTRRFSALGGWLDAMVDRGKEYAVYAGLAAGAAISGSGTVWTLAVAALGLQAVRHMVDFGYADAYPRVVAGLPRRPLDEPGDGREAHALPGEGVGTRPHGPGTAATRMSRRLEGRASTRWLKKIVAFPIGERFALISVTAALFHVRVTFAALLAWGGVAGIYILAGRVLRSFAREPYEAAAPAATYRDDGPLAQLVGAAGLVGLVPRRWRGRHGRFGRLGRRAGRLGWLAMPLLRGAEYALLCVLGIRSGAPVAVTFALLGAVVVHHYGMVYRGRQGVELPGWLCRAGLGWDGRMLAVGAAAAAGAVAPVYIALAGAVGIVVVGETVLTWRDLKRAGIRREST